jgi:ferrochelatase
MANFKGNELYIHGSGLKTGILLTNLGTPDEPTAPSLKTYLRQFLSDERVIETPKPIWWLILNGIVLRTRPAKSAKAYQSVWTDDGSPLLLYTKKQKNLIKEKLEKKYSNLVFDIGMRYGNPSIAEGLNNLRKQNCDRIIVLPLYPQYCAATTGSTFDAVALELQKWRWVPSLRFIGSYYDQPLYIQALKNSIEEFWSKNDKPKKLLFSYHGIPKKYLDKGDPYHCFCRKTTRLVAESMNLPKDSYMTTFQSRFGPAEWLQPYTDKTIESLAKEGTDDIHVISPAFSSDCLETIEELNEENREIFMENGGKKFGYIPCLNDRDDHILLLTSLLENELHGWV